MSREHSVEHREDGTIIVNGDIFYPAKYNVLKVTGWMRYSNWVLSLIILALLAGMGYLYVEAQNTLEMGASNMTGETQQIEVSITDLEEFASLSSDIESLSGLFESLSEELIPGETVDLLGYTLVVIPDPETHSLLEFSGECTLDGTQGTCNVSGYMIEYKFFADLNAFSPNVVPETTEEPTFEATEEIFATEIPVTTDEPEETLTATPTPSPTLTKVVASATAEIIDPSDTPIPSYTPTFVPTVTLPIEVTEEVEITEEPAVQYLPMCSEDLVEVPELNFSLFSNIGMVGNTNFGDVINERSFDEVIQNGCFVMVKLDFFWAFAIYSNSTWEIGNQAIAINGPEEFHSAVLFNRVNNESEPLPSYSIAFYTSTTMLKLVVVNQEGNVVMPEIGIGLNEIGLNRYNVEFSVSREYSPNSLCLQETGEDTSCPWMFDHSTDGWVAHNQ